MSMTEYPCNECGLPGANRVFDGGGTAYIHHSCPYRICFKCGQREIADMVKHVCPKAEEKDMANEISCPDCGHFRPHHFKSYYAYDRGCFWDDCPCTRTYESLTQINKQRCNHCGLLGDWSDIPKIGNMTREIDSRNQTTYWHDRCYESLVGEKQGKQLTPELQQYFDKCEQAREKDMATANTPETCPCANWSWVVGEYHDRTEHHPNCDGHGKPKTQFVTGMSIAEPELQLLVIDLGDCCLVKVEKGEWKRRTVTLYRGSATITLPFQRLREELGGVKPVPRIEQCGQEDFIMLYGTKGMHLTITAQQYKSLTEINGGKPLPIWTGGTWEELGHIDDEVYNNTDLRVWRYKR